MPEKGRAYSAPNGQGFRTYEGRCYHDACWQARCSKCDELLTSHDFDEEGARASAIDALTRNDRWGHRCG